MGFYSADVLIVGAGPVGLAAAIALKRTGLDVLVVDVQAPPIDKACGEGLMPGAIASLSRLGLDTEQLCGIRLMGIRFVDIGSEASAAFLHGDGLGVRRVDLHQALVDYAAMLGVRFRWRTRISMRPGEGLSLNGRNLLYRYLVAADGESSPTRAWAGLEQQILHSRRYGFRAHFQFTSESPAEVPNNHYVEVYWCDAGQAYVTPVQEGMVCIAVTSRSQSPGVFRQVVESIPALQRKISLAKQVTSQRGSVTTTSTLDRVAIRNIALIGDASGCVDAITGEGLTMGFRQALLLRDSIAAGGLEQYQIQHADTVRIPRRMARTLLLMDRHTALRRHILKLFSMHPYLFQSLLGIHLGEKTIYDTSSDETLTGCPTM